MNINFKAHILKRASAMLCSNIQQGNLLVDTKIRENGNLLEWHLSNGDMIEVYNHTDYSSGLPITPSTSISLYRDDEIIFEEIFIHEKK